MCLQNRRDNLVEMKQNVINNYLWCALLTTFVCFFLFLPRCAWKKQCIFKTEKKKKNKQAKEREKSENDGNPDEWNELTTQLVPIFFSFQKKKKNNNHIAHNNKLNDDIFISFSAKISSFD